MKTVIYPTHFLMFSVVVYSTTHSIEDVESTTLLIEYVIFLNHSANAFMQIKLT